MNSMLTITFMTEEMRLCWLVKYSMELPQMRCVQLSRSAFHVLRAD